MLVWRIADKARDLHLQHEVNNREGNSKCKIISNLRASGRKKFESASLATFNKKMESTKAGQCVEAEEDDLAAPNFNFEVESGDEDEDERNN